MGGEREREDKPEKDRQNLEKPLVKVHLHLNCRRSCIDQLRTTSSSQVNVFSSKEEKALTEGGNLNDK